MSLKPFKPKVTTAEDFLKSEGYNFEFYGTTAALLDKYAAIKIGENLPVEWPVAPKSNIELYTQKHDDDKE